jgi:phosphoribosylformylglycinamidine (FGAM) synthase-like amidotransferase family enzyme
MIRPRAVVLSGDGINCSNETAFALEQAGFEAVISHTSELLAKPKQLMKSELLALPGGFSFGDEIASGKVLAVKIRHRMLEVLHSYIEKGSLVLGICNGFQTLVQLGLLPNSEEGSESIVSLTHNSGGRFINRWVEMTVNSDSATSTNSPFFKGLSKISLPIRHGEGRIQVRPDAKDSDIAIVKERAALNYNEDVNGSFEKIAALTNSKGNVLGLMPHPEAYIRHSQHPAFQSWKRHSGASESIKDRQNGSSDSLENTPFENPPDGLTILKNAHASLS